jgi:hypothetical protein
MSAMSKCAEGHSRDLARVLGSRSLLGVHLRRDGQTIGSIVVSASEPNAFGDAEVGLLESFAEQALIAIENARLFNEVQTRSKELTESLEQQTATAEVLKVISRSAFDLQAVLDTLIESAVRLCNATRGTLRLRDGDLSPARAFAGNRSAESLEFLRQNPLKAGRGTVAGRAALTGLAQNVADVMTDPECDPRYFPGQAQNRSFLCSRLRHVRWSLSPPSPIRLSSRSRTRAYSTRCSRARAISPRRWNGRPRPPRCRRSSTPRPEISVRYFDAILEKAHSLCGAPRGSLQVFENGQLRAVATRGVGEPFSEILRCDVATSSTSRHRLQDQDKAVQIADLAEAPRSMPDEPILRAAVELARIRTFFSVPLHKDDAFLGPSWLRARRCVPGRNVNDPNMPTDSCRGPVRLIDLDLTCINHPNDNCYVPERHTGVRTEAQNGACLWFGATVIETGRGRPPTPCVAKQPDA